MVAEGGSLIDPKVVDAVVGVRSHAQDSPPAELTPREHQILAKIATEQRRHRGVAGASKRAVEKHINSLFLKLGLSQAAGHQQVDQGNVALPGRTGRRDGRTAARTGAITLIG